MQYICQVLTDTHPKVQAAGQTALQEVMFAYFTMIIVCYYALSLMDSALFSFARLEVS
jgi:hypothetical protein